jgi:hypothetical protein
MIDGMGIGMLGILMDGNDDTIDIPQIEGPKEKGMDGVGPMELRVVMWTSLGWFP